MSNIKLSLLVLLGSIYGVMLFITNNCNAASYPRSTTTPLAVDLSMNQYKLTDVDIVAQGPWVDARRYTNLKAAVTDIGSVNETTLVIPHSFNVNDGTAERITVTPNITLQFIKAGKLVKVGSGTVTINGSLQAPLKEVFSGFSAGDILFGQQLDNGNIIGIDSGIVQIISPRWWGAKGDWDGSTGTDDTTALNNCFSALSNAKTMAVNLGFGRYRVTSTIDVISINNGYSHRIYSDGGYENTGHTGAGAAINFRTSIDYDGLDDITIPVLRLTNAQGTVLEGFTVNARRKTGYCVQLRLSGTDSSSNLNILDRLTLAYPKRDAVLIGDETAPPASRTAGGNIIRDCTVIGYGRSAVHTNESECDDLRIYNLNVNPDPSGIHVASYVFWGERLGSTLRIEGGTWESGCSINGSGADAGFHVYIPNTGNGVYMANVLGGPNVFITGAHLLGIMLVDNHYGHAGRSLSATATDAIMYFDFPPMTVTGGTYRAKVLILNGTVGFGNTGGPFLGNVYIGPNTTSEQISIIGLQFGVGYGIYGVDVNGSKIDNNPATGDIGFPSSLVTHTSASGTISLNRFAKTQRIMMTGNITGINSRGVITKGPVTTFIFVQDATGGRTVDWKSTWGSHDPFRFYGDENPQPNPNPNSVTVYRFINDNDEVLLCVGMEKVGHDKFRADSSGGIFPKGWCGDTIISDSSVGVVTYTLPSASNHDNMEFTVVRKGVNAVRIDPNGTELIYPGASGQYLSLDSNGGSVTIKSYGGNSWYIVSSYGTIGWY